MSCHVGYFLLKQLLGIIVPIFLRKSDLLRKFSFKLSYNMSHCSNKKSSRSARAVQYFFINLRINHLNSHFHDISRGKELTTIATQIRTYYFFIGFTLNINIRIEQAVLLQLTYNISETSRRQLYFVVRIKYLAVFLLNTLKNLANTLLNR